MIVFVIACFDEARYRNVLLPDMQSLVLGLGAFTGNDTPSEPSSYGNRTEPVNATVTHDEQSLIYEMTQFHGVAASEAVQRDKLYGALMFTSLGIPMLWQGMEFAEPRGWPSDGQKLSYRPVQFTRLQTSEGQSAFLVVPVACASAQDESCLVSRGLFRPLYQYSSQKVLVWGFEDTLSTRQRSWLWQTSAACPIRSPRCRGSPQEHGTMCPDGSAMAVSSMTIDTIVVPAYTALVYSTIRDTLLAEVGSRGETIVPGSLRRSNRFSEPVQSEYEDTV